MDFSKIGSSGNRYCELSGVITYNPKCCQGCLKFFRKQKQKGFFFMVEDQRGNRHRIFALTNGVVPEWWNFPVSVNYVGYKKKPYNLNFKKEPQDGAITVTEFISNFQF